VTSLFGIKGVFLRFLENDKMDLRQFFSGFRRKHLCITTCIEKHCTQPLRWCNCLECHDDKLNISIFGILIEGQLAGEAIRNVRTVASLSSEEQIYQLYVLKLFTSARYCLICLVMCNNIYKSWA